MKSPLLRRMFGFALLPVVTAITPFLVLPILARVGGVDVWVAVAVGQSIGGALSLVVSLGMNVVGPTLIGGADSPARRQLFLSATRARLIVLFPAAAVAAAASSLVAPAAEQGTAALMSFAVILGGISSAWYMFGEGRPTQFMLVELIPKAVATGLGSLILLFTGSIVWYPAFLIIASVAGFLWFTRRVVTYSELFTPRLRQSMVFIRAHWAPALTESAGGAYASLTVTLVGVAASPAQTASYVAGDKLYKLGQSAIGTLGNSLQGWVVEDGLHLLTSRFLRSLIAHAAMGALGLALFVLLGPNLTSALFGPTVAIDQMTSLGLGFAVLALSLNTSFGRHLLIPAGRPKSVLHSVLAGAAVGVPSIVILSHFHGAAGGAMGLALSETVVLAVQLVLARRLLSRRD